MVLHNDTSADSEFRARRFIEEIERYSKELLNVDSLSASEKVELLHKLGASQQKAGRFQDAAETLEQLLEAQDEAGSSQADKVITYLSLAQTHDMCEMQRDAEVEFKIAYKLAKAIQPKNESLQCNAIDSYINWLVKTGGDKNLTAILRKELKSLQNGTENVTPSNQGVLISRGERAAPRFAPQEDAVDQLSNEIESTHEGIDKLSQDFRPDAAPDGTPRINADHNLSDIDTGSRSILPLSANRANEDSLAANWSDLPIRSQPSMKGSARSYFKEAPNLASGIDKTVEEERSWPRQLMMIVPLVIVAVVFGLFVNSVVNEPKSKEVPHFYKMLMGKRFATADGSLTLAANAKGITIAGPGVEKTVKPLIYTGSVSDELKLLRGTYGNAVWISDMEDGLQDSRGLKLWDENSAQSQIVHTMNNIAAGAQSFYQNMHRYPLSAEAKNLFSYRNPITKAVEPVQCYSATTYCQVAGTRDRRLETAVYRGDNFEKETSPTPGAISFLSVINKSNGMVELPNQPVECQVAYIHAFDSEGKLIKCPLSEKPLILALIKGKTERVENKDVAAHYAAGSIAISQGSPPVAAAVLFKYFGCAILVIGLIAYLIYVKITASRE